MSDAPSCVAAVLADELVASLLLVHGLHPDDARRRGSSGRSTRAAVPRHHGGDVELVDIDETRAWCTCA